MERRAPWTVPSHVLLWLFGIALILLGSAFPNDGALDDVTIACGLVMVVATRGREVVRRGVLRGRGPRNGTPRRQR